MARNRMTDADKLALIEAYKAWQPGDESAEQLANRFGVTRSAMYQVLKDNGIALRTGRTSARVAPEPLMSEMAKVLAEVLLDQLAALKQENKELRARLEDRP